MVYSPAQPPEPMIRRWLPSPSPSPTAAQPLSSIVTAVTNNTQPPQPSKLPIYFSPPLIAMVVIAAAAFLLVTYSRLISRKLLPPIFRLHHKFRRWRRRRRRSIHRHPSSSFNALDSPPLYLSDGFGSATTYSPYGLDESAIRAMPLSIYSEKARLIEEFSSDCAVCLLEFEENDYVRTLPHCCHSFHVECIDAWLRSHATCPLCRAGLFPLDSSSPPLFSPLMAARIRPSLDEGLLESLFYLDPLPESFQRTTPTSNPLRTPGRRVSASDFNGGDAEIEVESLSAATPHDRSDMVLKRSYSFGFERSFVSSAMTTSPSWRFHQHRRGGSSFWRRPSPFGSITKSRVFSFRSYRGVGGTGGGLKSPFFFSSRRRGFAPLSESAGMRYSSPSASHYYHHHQCCHLYCCSGSSAGVGGGGSSSRRSKSFASPMMCGGRMSVTASSRMRCGDPEALLSPERFGRR